MSRYLLTQSARDDLERIADFIRVDSPTAALRVLAELRRAIRRLARMPEIGHFREDLADEPIRFWPVRSYLIIYRADVRPIEVLRVLHAARDVRAIFR